MFHPPAKQTNPEEKPATKDPDITLEAPYKNIKQNHLNHQQPPLKQKNNYTTFKKHIETFENGISTPGKTKNRYFTIKPRKSS